MRQAPSKKEEPHHVDLWIWELDVPALLRDRFAAHLSPDELARSRRFVLERHSTRFVSGRGRMREILSGYVGRNPEDLAFGYNAYGKPSLVMGPGTPALHFNLSHSDGLAALGICRSIEIGVDIEAVRPIEEDVAAHYFSPVECRSLASLPDVEQLAGFYRCWTRKEAFIKALGHGMSLPLDSFAVSLGPYEPAGLLWWRDNPGAPSLWSIWHFEPRRNWIGAIAAPSDKVVVQARAE